MHIIYFFIVHANDIAYKIINALLKNNMNLVFEVFSKLKILMKNSYISEILLSFSFIFSVIQLYMRKT